MKLSLVLLVVLVVSSVLLVQTDGKKVEKKKETIEEKGKTGKSHLLVLLPTTFVCG